MPSRYLARSVRRVDAVGVGGVHRGADREPADQAAPRQQVDHRHLLGDADRRVVEGDGVAEHRDRGPRRAGGEHRGDQVRRRHQPVAVAVVLVDADAVEPARLGVDELIDVALVAVGDDGGIEQRRVDVDPDAAVLRVEVGRQLRVRHQVEPEQLHDPHRRRPPAACPRPSADTDHVATDNVRRDGRGRRPAAAALLRGRGRGAPLRAGGGPAAHARHRRCRNASASSSTSWASRLFERTSRRVALTPAGERLLGDARDVLRSVDRFDGHRRRAGRRAVAVDGRLLPRQRGRDDAHDRRLPGRASRRSWCRADGLTSLRILDGVRDGRIAVGIVRGPVVDPDRVASRPLARVPVDHVAVPPDHRAGGRRRRRRRPTSTASPSSSSTAPRRRRPTTRSWRTARRRVPRRAGSRTRPCRSSESSTSSPSAPASAGSTRGRRSGLAGAPTSPSARSSRSPCTTTSSSGAPPTSRRRPPPSSVSPSTRAAAPPTFIRSVLQNRPDPADPEGQVAVVTRWRARRSARRHCRRSRDRGR